MTFNKVDIGILVGMLALVPLSCATVKAGTDANNHSAVKDSTVPLTSAAKAVSCELQYKNIVITRDDLRTLDSLVDGTSAVKYPANYHSYVRLSYDTRRQFTTQIRAYNDMCANNRHTTTFQFKAEDRQ